MENGKNLLKNILSWVLFSLITLAFLFFVVTAILGRKYALYVCLGMVTHYFLSSVFHEVGHLLVGKSRKMVFVQGKILFFNFYRKGKKLKVGLCYPFETGEISMVSRSVNEAGKDLVLLSLAGNLFTFVYLVICLALGMIIRGYLGWYFFVLASVSTAYTLIINLIPLAENGDGALLFGLIKSKENYKSAISLAVANAYLYSGVSPSDIPDGVLYLSSGYYSQRVELLKLLKLIDSSKMERAYVYSGELLTRCDDDVRPRVLKERFFLAVIMSLSEEVEKLKEQVLPLLDGGEAEDMRISYYYRLYTKENEWANLIKASAEKSLNNEFFNGVASMEKKLLEFKK